MCEAETGRSANKGACSQMCRMSYDLFDENGNQLLKNKHLLSLEDFDASQHLRALLDAGVYSLKIEGRLKDINYVKNITAYYRRLLDGLMPTMGLQASSYGKVKLMFDPNPKKSFFRGATPSFLSGDGHEVVKFDTPNSMGEPVGMV